MAYIIKVLEDAALQGNIDKLYETIDKDSAVLEKADAKSFFHTPLHVAASEGHISFAIEIMRLKPSFALKLNEQGYSPIHVALRKDHHNLVRRLVEVNKDLARVKGREGNTPLHYLCESDSQENIELLVDLLEACPDSINEVNVKNETALHVALKYGYFIAFRIMVNWLNRNTEAGAALLEESTLNKKDEDGNTVLHLSALHGNTQAVKLLLRRPEKIKLNEKNLEEKTALDLTHIASEEIKKLLEEAKAKSGASIPKPIHKLIEQSYLSYRSLTWIELLRARRELSAERRSAYMVVASLMITTIYKIAVSPTGGGHPDTGNSILESTPLIIQMIFNIVVFYYAIFAVIVLLPSGLFGIFQACLLLTFALTYILSFIFVLPKDGFTVPSVFLSLMAFAFISFYVLRRLKLESDVD